MLKVSYILTIVLGLTSGFLLGSNLIVSPHITDIIAMVGMTLTFVFYLLFVINMLREVYSSQKLALPEKIMWTVGGLFAMSIVGLIYLLLGRKRALDIH